MNRAAAMVARNRSVDAAARWPVDRTLCATLRFGPKVTRQNVAGWCRPRTFRKVCAELRSHYVVQACRRSEIRRWVDARETKLAELVPFQTERAESPRHG